MGSANDPGNLCISFQAIGVCVLSALHAEAMAFWAQSCTVATNHDMQAAQLSRFRSMTEPITYAKSQPDHQ
jgi:hypothetical protein